MSAGDENGGGGDWIITGEEISGGGGLKEILAAFVSVSTLNKHRKSAASKKRIRNNQRSR